MLREEALQLLHRGSHDLLIRATDPIFGRSKHQLEHGALGVFVFAAGVAHVGIDAEQGRAAEQQVINIGELPVKPEMDVDHWHSAQAVELAEERHLLPRLRQQQLERIHRHGTDVRISREGVGLLASHPTDAEAGDRAIAVEFDLTQGRFQMHFAAFGLDVLNHGLAETLRRIAIEEGHFRAVLLLQEAIQCRQQNGAGNLIGINEVQRLAHGDEHLIVDPLWDVVEPEPFGPGVLIALLHITLAAQHRGHQTQTKADLFWPAEHVVVAQDGCHTIDRCWQIREIKAAVGARDIFLVEDHRVAFPLQPLLDVQLLEELQHVRVGPEKDVQAGLIPITVFVLPGRHLAAQDVAGFHHHWRMAGITEIFGTGEPSEASSSNCHPHRRARRTLRAHHRVEPMPADLSRCLIPR